MRYLLLLVFPALLAAQSFEVRFMGATATQAVLRLRNWSGVCTMEVRENDASGALHPDWAAIADNTHPLTTINSANEKFLVIGQRRSNKALATVSNYYYAISGCGTATGRFVTAPPAVGQISHKQPPSNPQNWSGIDYPDIDLTGSAAARNKWYVHPMTGIRHRLVSQPEDFSWMDHANQTFVHPTGGSGWTDAAAIVNGSSSTAQTSNTNPMYLYANITGSAAGTQPWNGAGRTLENIGLVLWGQCVSGTGADCDIELMLFDDPAVLPKAGSNIVTVRTGGTFIQLTTNHPTTGDFASTLSAAVTSGTTTYPGGTTGSNGFPRVGFLGWGNFRLQMDQYIRNPVSTGTISGGNTITITAGASVNNNFPRGIKAGQHIWVEGSAGACATTLGDDICTVGTASHSGSVILTDTGLTNGAVNWRALPWGVAIRKKTATGTVRIGAMYRASGHFPITTGTLQPRCSQVSKTRTDGVVGRLCSIPHGGSYNYLYFISDDGEEVVPLDGMQQFGGNTNSMDFHPTDPATVYIWHPATGLYKQTHTGDFGVTNTVWEKDPGAGGARYAHNGGGSYPDATWSDPYFSITQVLTTASISSQITAQYPSQVTTPYPAWSGSFVGLSGELAVFYRLLEGQDSGPCQIAVFNADNGTLVDFVNTGHDPGSPHNFGECHSIQLHASVPNSIFHSYNIVGAKAAPNPNLLLHGPHRLQIEAVMRAGSWHTNTCLEWPMLSTSGGCAGLGSTLAHYDKTCPGGLSASWVAQGAQTPNCVTMKISGSTAAKAICNENGNDTGSNDDFTLFGACEWNAGPTYSGGPTLEAGMKFVDRAAPFGSAGDYENFRILTITPTGDGTTLTVVAQRNACREHCCGANGTQNPAPLTSTVCIQADSQVQHATGWFAMMVPGWYGSCNAPAIYTTWPSPPNKATKYHTEIPRNLSAGHTSLGRTVGPAFRYVGATGARNLANFAELAIQPPPATNVLKVTWNDTTSPIGGSLQQYLSQGQIDQADTTNKYFTGDANHINGSGGTEQNSFSGGIPDVRTTYNKVAGFPNLYRVVVSGSSTITAIKNRPIVGWCGPKALTNISSPATGAQIDTAPDYSFCVAQKAGQCRSGSSVGAVWVQCPWAYIHPTAAIQDDFNTGMEFTSTPGLLSVAGPAGFVRRQRTDIPDESGSSQMLVSDFFKPAGSQFAYWNAPISPAGKYVMAVSGGHFGLSNQVAWLAQVPKLPVGMPRYGGYQRRDIKLGSRPGMTHARVRYGSNPSFHCNRDYLTACVTDAVITPYAFDDETLSPIACSSGCTLSLHIYGDEPVWYQIEKSTDGGTNFTADAVQIMVP